jgi:hypothetical protein
LNKRKEVADLIDKLKQSDVSIRKISKILEIPEQRMYGWTNKNATPSHEDVEKLKQYFGYNQNILNDEGGNDTRKVSLSEKVKAHDALFSVLVSEIAALRSASTGEPVQSLIMKYYKAAEDAGDSLPG